MIGRTRPEGRGARRGSARRLALWVAVSAPLACGRPATEAECAEIVARVTELALTEAGGRSADEVAAEVAREREELGGATRDACVGRRLPRGALDCVRRAVTAEEIVKRCLR